MVVRIERALAENKPLRALDIARHVDGATRRNPSLLKHWIAAATATRAWGEARKVAKELAAVDGSAQNLLQLATLERTTGRAEDAKKTLFKLLNLHPDHAEAKTLLLRIEPVARVAAR
jgi:thioredoxin-like negative regulator of GroEL